MLRTPGTVSITQPGTGSVSRSRQCRPADDERRRTPPGCAPLGSSIPVENTYHPVAVRAIAGSCTTVSPALRRGGVSGGSVASAAVPVALAAGAGAAEAGTSGVITTAVSAAETRMLRRNGRIAHL